MAASLKENNMFFVMDQTPCPYPTRSLPAQFSFVIHNLEVGILIVGNSGVG
jgi:hypothetical protein